MSKNSALPPLLLSLLLAAAYLLTASQGMFWQDAPRFVAAIATFGVSKPPEPLYMILAHPFALLPFGSLVFRIQVLSAIFAAVTLFSLYKLIEKILKQIVLSTKDKVQFLAITVSLAGLFGLLTLGLAPSFWTQAQNVDDFVLVSLLVTLILLLIVTPINKKNFLKRFLLVAALLGFATGTNPIVFSVLPGVLLVLSDNRRYLSFKGLLMIGFTALLAMVLVYSYLPLAASRNPFLNWNRPTDLSRIWELSTGGGLNVYDPQRGLTNGFTGSVDVFFTSSWVFFQMAWTNFSLFLPLVIIGVVFLLRKSMRIFSILFFTVLINFVISGIYLSGNQESWYLVSYVIFAVFAAIGFFWVVTKLPKRNLLIILLFSAQLIILVYRYPQLDNRKWQISDDYIRNLYHSIEPPAIIYGSGDLFFSTSYYAHDVAPFGKGVIPIVSEIYRFSWYRENLRKTTALAVPEPEPGPVNPQNYWRYLNQFFNANLPKYKIYITHRALSDDFPIAGSSTSSLPQISDKFKLVPAGMALELVLKNSPRVPIPSDFEYEFNPPDFPKVLPQLYVRSYVVEMVRAVHDYAISYQSLADYALVHNRKDLALEFYQKAYKLESDQKTYNFDPNVEIIGRLGNYYADSGDLKKAEGYFNQGLTIDPHNVIFHLDLGILEAASDSAQSRFHLNQVIQLAPDSEYSQRAEELLKEIKEK